MLSCNKVWKKWIISGVSQAGTAWLRKFFKIRATRVLGGRVGRSPLRGSAENWAKMNYFRAKPEFIIIDYIIARETAQPAMKYPLLSIFQLRISLWVLWIASKHASRIERYTSVDDWRSRTNPTQESSHHYWSCAPTYLCRVLWQARWRRKSKSMQWLR